MAIRIEEKPTSRKGTMEFNNPSCTLECWAVGDDGEDEQDLARAVESWREDTFTINGITHWYQSWNYEPKSVTPYALWDISIKYGKSANTSELTVEAGGGTRKVMYALETIENYPCDGRPEPDFENAINVTEQGIDGVDVPDFKFSFSLAYKLARTSVPGSYVMDLYGLRNHTNDEEFTLTYNGLILTFARGTLLFTGFPFKMTSEQTLDITYKFEAQRSLLESDNFRIGTSDIITKTGWEYLWVYQRESRDTVSNRMVRKPVSAHVVRVFERGDFSIIRMG